MNTQSSAVELAFIRNIMAQTHSAALANGHYFVAWGLLLSAGITYGELQSAWRLGPSPGQVWIALLTIGWLYTIGTHLRERQHRRASSYSGRLLAAEWISCGVSMSITFVVGGMSGAVTQRAFAGLTATFLAGAVMATARLAGAQWLACVACLWWVCALVLFVLPPNVTGLVLAGSLLGLFVAPGIALQIQARRLPSRTV